MLERAFELVHAKTAVNLARIAQGINKWQQVAPARMLGSSTGSVARLHVLGHGMVPADATRGHEVRPHPSASVCLNRPGFVGGSKAQLDTTYGNDAETVLTNHRSKLIYPSGTADLASMQYVGELVGDEHVLSDLDDRGWNVRRDETLSGRSAGTALPYLPCKHTPTRGGRGRVACPRASASRVAEVEADPGEEPETGGGLRGCVAIEAPLQQGGSRLREPLEQIRGETDVGLSEQQIGLLDQTILRLLIRHRA